ncbi:MAG TPA: LysR family transcriptional regulator [Buttiauxella sp.]|nr:LysR family transcriptional regulator [Buttiauxella sp.]
MDIKLLRAFVTLGEQGSYRAAADILCMTQSALTKQIQSLEHHVGVSLFIRGRHGAKLTAQGTFLFSHALSLLKNYGEFRKYVLELQKGNVGKLALGLGISSLQMVPEWVNTFREKFHEPDVQISLNDIPSGMQCQMLLDGDLQVGFVRLPVDKQLNVEVLMEEKLALVVPSSVLVDPANIQPVLDIHPLLQINPHRGPCLAEQIASFLKANRLVARLNSPTDDIHTLLALVAAGNGVAFLPACAGYFLPEGVKLVQPEGKQIGWQIGVAWNPAIQDVLRDKFIEMITAKSLMI